MGIIISVNMMMQGAFNIWEIRVHVMGGRVRAATTLKMHGTVRDIVRMLVWKVGG